MDKYLGKRLDGRYIIKELIGVGGMAYVYKAYDSIDDRTVALKILKDEFLENEEFTRRFKNESKAIAILSHPNIVRVFDVSFGEQLQYIVMEYIDGITLKEYIDQQQDIKWKEAVHFTVQILRALQHAHDKGVVHRDIKPQNIMMLPDGTIKVMDFGIARLSRNDVRATVNTDKAIGSVHYISPEQARGDVTDEKSDIYSVGVMLYEMLTGRLPFDSHSAVSVAIMQLQSEPTAPHEINPDIPEGLEQITVKAMQKDPEKRYRTAAEMLYDIDEFKRNPSIHFEYKYMVDEPTRYVGSVPLPESPEDVEEEDEDDEEERKAPIFAILASVAGAIVVAAIIFVCVVMLPRIIQGDATDNITVDKFIGMNYAEEVLTNATYADKYTFAELQYEFNSTYPAGTVIKQSPAPDTTIKKKGTLTLTISKGPRTQTVDDVTRLDPEEAARILRDVSGFQVVIAQQSSDEIPAGFVIRTVPAAGDPAEYGSKITIFVSTGAAKPDPIEMVDVVSSSAGSIAEEDAKNMLIDAGFTVGKTVYVNGPYAAGFVLEQSTTPGEMYDPGYEVVLTVSSGFRDVELTVPLDSVNTTVDFRVYIDGTAAEALSLFDKHPSIRKVTFKLTEQKEMYTVAVQISKAGSNNWQDYYIYQIDGVYGSVTILEENEFNPDPPTTTPTTAPSTTVPSDENSSPDESSSPEESSEEESSVITEDPGTDESSSESGETIA